MATFGFIGTGNMGYAMMTSIMKIYEKAEIIFTDINRDRMKEVYNETGIRFMESNAELVNNCKYVVLAVKPQVYPAVIKNIENILTPNHVLISIAPGWSIEKLHSMLGSDKRIVRAMPNTPALIGEGMTGICYDDRFFGQDEKDEINRFFTSFGKVKKLDENLMNVVTCVSGSSPAYIFMLVEAMADAAVKYGMSRKDAYEFAAQTVQGSARMVLQTGMHPGALKDMVCSPAGTTIQGVSALEENGFRNAVIAATDACYKKCTEL